MIAEEATTVVELADRKLGVGQPALIIGEVAQAHDGSLGYAHAYVDAIAEADCDAVKFQTHIAAAESTPAEPWRVRFSRQDATRFDYWRRMEFTPHEWAGLKKHAEERGLIFLSSPFSEQAVDLLETIGMAGWKVASGEVENFCLLEKMAVTGKPVLLSSGMSDWAALDAAVELLRNHDCGVALFQCTTAYPSSAEQVGLNLIDQLRRRYGVCVGLSDHSGTIYPALAAATLGVEMIEVHVTMSREMFGPDVPASVTTSELQQLVEGVRFIEQAIASPLEKDDVARDLAPLRQTFGKSIVLRHDLPAGTRLERPHLALKKPGHGLPPRALDRVVGRRLTVAATADQFITDEMLAD